MVIAWIIVGYLVIFIPIAELWAHHRYKKQIAANIFKKHAFYNSVFLELWSPVIGVFILMIMGIIQLQDLKINLIIWNPYGINDWLFFAAIVMACIPVLLILLSVYNYIGFKLSPAFRAAYIAAVKKQEENTNESKAILFAILPSNFREKILWVFVSFTAGVTEEILFRGFLVFWIHHCIPAIPIPFLFLLQAIPFGLMHLYQGRQGVITTLLLGVIFGLYVIVSGSIIPGIIVHILLDLSSNLLELDQTRAEPLELS